MFLQNIFLSKEFILLVSMRNLSLHNTDDAVSFLTIDCPFL